MAAPMTLGFALEMTAALSSGVVPTVMHLYDMIDCFAGRLLKWYCMVAVVHACMHPCMRRALACKSL